MKVIFLLIPVFLLSACNRNYQNKDANPLHLPPQGFVGNSQQGEKIYQQNCQSCHGINAEGTLTWKKTDSNGNYPPPPLDGTANAWHHDISVLKNTIQVGGVALGGTMPPFKDKLSDREIENIIAYFQSKWPDELYQQWENRNKQSDLPVIGSFKY